MSPPRPSSRPPPPSFIIRRRAGASPSTSSPALSSAQSWYRAFGQAYMSSSALSFAVQYLIFFVLLIPLALGLWAASALIGPRVFQGFAAAVATGPLRNTLLGTLLMRIPGSYDLLRNGGMFLATFQQKMWIDTLDPSARRKLDQSCGRNLFLWDTLRIGEYKLAREITLDPGRKRTTALDGWMIKGGQAARYANMPLFFNTGSRYHTQWRAAFAQYITDAPSVRAKLADNGRLAREQTRPILNRWLSTGFDGIQPPMVMGEQYIARPVFSLILSLLFDVHEPPDDLVEAATLFVTIGALYWLLPPSYPALFHTPGTLAVGKLKAFLYTHCNAAKPETLKGRAVDWIAMADSIADVGSIDARAGGEDGKPERCRPASKCCRDDEELDNPKIDALLNSVCLAVMLAATAGTSTATINSLCKFIHFPRGAYFPKLMLNQPSWQPDAEEMVALYRKDPLSFILETLRLACPVAGSHKVLDEPIKCPFLNGEKTFPTNTVVVANFNVAHIDPAEWGDDALKFRPGRAAHDRYMIWNGPYGGSAPRQCPGEELATTILILMLSAFVDEFFPADGGASKKSSEAQARAADVEGGVTQAAPLGSPTGSTRHPMMSFIYQALR